MTFAHGVHEKDSAIKMLPLCTLNAHSKRERSKWKMRNISQEEKYIQMSYEKRVLVVFIKSSLIVFIIRIINGRKRKWNKLTVIEFVLSA